MPAEVRSSVLLNVVACAGDKASQTTLNVIERTLARSSALIRESLISMSLRVQNDHVSENNSSIIRPVLLDE